MAEAPQTVMSVAIHIVAMSAAHWPEVSRIYQAGIDTGHATFETATPTWEQFDAVRRDSPRLVGITPTGRVVGWVACSSVSSRPAYAGVVEHSIFVDPSHGGTGVGRKLLQAFVRATEQGGIWTVQSGVFPENAASLRLHAATGFRVVGVRERVARMMHGPMRGQWRDVVLIERRSTTVGA